MREMRKFFSKFTLSDWLTFALGTLLFALTVVPIFVDAPWVEGWLSSALISLGAATLGALVLGQIAGRENDQDLNGQLSSIKSILETSVTDSAVHEIPAGQIGAELETMLRSASEWYFRGGSARWQR